MPGKLAAGASKKDLLDRVKQVRVTVSKRMRGMAQVPDTRQSKH